MTCTSRTIKNTTQDGKNRPLRLWFVWFIWFLWCIRLVWFNQINETNQTNQRNQPALTLHGCRERHWQTALASCSGKTTHCRLHWRDCETRKNPGAEGQSYQRSAGTESEWPGRKGISRLRKNFVGTRELRRSARVPATSSGERHTRRTLPQDAQKGCPARPQRAKRRSRTFAPYVEPLSEARTPLAAFFSILPVRGR
jgi:hypothetical protein